MSAEQGTWTVNLTMNNDNEIKPGVIDLSRFDQMPVLLHDHQSDRPIGMAENIRLDDKGLYFVPAFYDKEQAKKYLEYLSVEGILVAQPGGIIELDDEGNINKFILLEISICHDRRNN